MARTGWDSCAEPIAGAGKQSVAVSNYCNTLVRALHHVTVRSTELVVKTLQCVAFHSCCNVRLAIE